ncbi:MAG: DUF305 domain-containing protein [Gemmatimonadaceae bacterium]
MFCFVLHALRRRAVVATLALVSLAACARNDKAQDSAVASGIAATGKDTIATSGTGDSMAGQDMSAVPAMANMTGDADHDFLRMMSDHHHGLILMAHMTKDRKESSPAVSDARKLDAAQDKELDHMVTMLEKDFKDPYSPKVMPEHQAMADALKAQTGTGYDRTFYQNVIKHHQDAITMIDAYLPKAKNPMVKQMAEKMKADQAKEIVAFQQKVSKLGA